MHAEAVDARVVAVAVVAGHFEVERAIHLARCILNQTERDDR